MSGLIVPVEVMAYCVGTLDAHGPARRFAGGTTDFRNQTKQGQAFLGINVTRDFGQIRCGRWRPVFICTGRCPMRSLAPPAMAGR